MRDAAVRRAAETKAVGDYAVEEGPGELRHGDGDRQLLSDDELVGPDNAGQRVARQPLETGSEQFEREFEYSYQLVEFIKQMGDFSIGTAGFPESHIACTEGHHVDWQRLKAKIDHGADFVLTQLFFDNDDYFSFRDYLVDTLGVSVPITPGILPILNTGQIKRFTALCGATLPAALATKLESYGDDADAVADFGIELATRQCEALLAGGAPGLHFYSLNRPDAATRIVRNLGLRE